MLQAGHKHDYLYREALLLTAEIYRITTLFPDSEHAGLLYTLRRLVVTLCQNLAAAAVQKDKKQLRLFRLCRDTCIAIDTQLEIAITVHLINTDETAEAAKHLDTIYKNIITRLQTK